MSEFREADARLGAMHGYRSHACSGSGACPICRENLAGWSDAVQQGLLVVVHRLDALEAKLDALIHALQAGAVGDWRGQHSEAQQLRESEQA